MKETDVFIDLESLGIGSPQFALLEEARHVDTLLNELPDRLASAGFTLRNIWATARVKRSRSSLPGTLQIELKRALVRHGGVMVWTKEIADETLKREVRARLTGGTLAESVLLVACDGDFTELAEELIQAGRFVIVSGRTVSRRLSEVASKFIPLTELNGEVVEFTHEPPLPNPLPLP